MNSRLNRLDGQQAREKSTEEQLHRTRVFAEPLGNATDLHTPPLKTVDYLDENTGEFITLGKLSDSESIVLSRKIRFDLQDTASNLLHGYFKGGAPTVTKIINDEHRTFEKHHRTCTCTRFLNSNTAQILKSVDYNKVFFGGTMNCANSRTCPICAQKINERKANEMRQAFNVANSQDLYVTLLTFTAPHTAKDSLDFLLGNDNAHHYNTVIDVDGICKTVSNVSLDVIDELAGKTNTVLDEIIPVKKIKIKKKKQKNRGILGAMESFWAGATATRFKEKYKIVGNIRSFEIRYGENGWHPHFHIVLFSKIPLPATIKEDKKPIELEDQCPDWIAILNRWQSVCLNNGLNEPNQYGMDIQDGANASSYITKFGSNDEILETKLGKKITWDMADEMTKGNVKTGRKGSLSPWDLLAIIGEKEDFDKVKKAKALFLEYSRAMYRVTMVKWSRGLRKMFDLGKEKTDQEIIELEESSADVLCHLTPREWRFIYLNKHRAMILQLAENGGRDAVANFIFDNLYHGDFNVFYKQFINRDHEFSDINDFSQKGDLHCFDDNGDRVVKMKKTKAKQARPIKNCPVVYVDY
jgi:hypothetical protein